MESSLRLSWHYWHRANSANPLEYNGFALFMPSVPLLPNPHGRPPILRHYVQSSPHLFDRSSMAKQNLSHRANVICDGSPSRIRMVRRISLGITTRPRSSMRRTIPVAFIYKFPPVKADFSLVVSAAAGVLCTGSFFHNTADFAS